MLETLWRTRVRLLLVVGAMLGTAGWLSAASSAANLPDGRAYELVSSGEKLGNDVLSESSRTRASLDETLASPSAVSFASLGGFADVQGTGIATEYLSQRAGVSATSGWTLHAITPRQESLPFFATTRNLEPVYRAASQDLSKALFQSWSPLTNAPNVAGVTNLYAREDLRTAGVGTFRLLSDAASPLPAFSVTQQLVNPLPAGFTQNLGHVVFESSLALTSDATGGYVKLYKSDGLVTRLVSAGPGCAGGSAAIGPGQCAAAGLGAQAFRYTPRVLSQDGSRLLFTSPLSTSASAGSTINGVSTRPGVVSKLFQLDDRGTATTDDDALIHVSASERTTSELTQAARYQTASADGARVFFVSAQQLTDRPGGGLYLWERRPTDETQSISIDATGGTFTLTHHAQVSTGSGTLTSGSNVVRSVTAGSFAIGETVTGAGIPPGTTITALGTFSNATNSTLTLSANATASGVATLTASMDATTAVLPHDAPASQVADALEALAPIGSDSVTVTGGDGSAPYVVTFTGSLAGVNVAQLSANGSGLTGGGASATVVTTRPVSNLALLASMGDTPITNGVIGASEDGGRVYFAAAGAQLVSGGPAIVGGTGIYYWQDADGTPGGTLSFVGGVQNGDVSMLVNSFNPGSGPSLARVTPDGRVFAFLVSDGAGLAPGVQQLAACTENGNPNQNSASGCGAIYVYRADSSTPTAPDLVCASCRPSGEPLTLNAWMNIRRGASATAATSHVNRALSADGRRVFFSTAEALVPEDKNGRYDAYEYDVPSGTAHLISSGRDAFDSYFLDASANGDDVYFVTRERLVGWDADVAYDLYDARVGGGFPEPPAPPAVCAGDACQGAAPAAPGATAVGSAIFRGAGNARPRPAKKCRRGKVKRSVRGRVRCVRRKSRAAEANRRGAATRRTK